MRLFARRSKNFTVPQPPRHFLYKRQDRIEKREARPSMAERKIFVPKSLSHCLKEGRILVRGSRDSETLLDWVSLARARFARHRTEKPATKAGQIRALWPDIEAALEGGQSMKSIRKWLEEDAGITLGITSLTSYISRIRRRLAAKRRTSCDRAIVQPQTHPDQTPFVRCDSGSGGPAPNTIRSLKPSGFCRNRSSTSASSITTAIQKAEI